MPYISPSSNAAVGFILVNTILGVVKSGDALAVEELFNALMLKDKEQTKKGLLGGADGTSALLPSNSSPPSFVRNDYCCYTTVDKYASIYGSMWFGSPHGGVGLCMPCRYLRRQEEAREGRARQLAHHSGAQRQAGEEAEEGGDAAAASTAACSSPHPPLASLMVRYPNLPLTMDTILSVTDGDDVVEEGEDGGDTSASHDRSGTASDAHQNTHSNNRGRKRYYNVPCVDCSSSSRRRGSAARMVGANSSSGGSSGAPPPMAADFSLDAVPEEDGFLQQHVTHVAASFGHLGVLRYLFSARVRRHLVPSAGSPPPDGDSLSSSFSSSLASSVDASTLHAERSPHHHHHDDGSGSIVSFASLNDRFMDGEYRSALFCAVEEGHVDCVAFLLSGEGEGEGDEVEGVGEGEDGRGRRTIKSSGIDPSKPFYHRWPVNCLHYACKGGHFELVRLFMGGCDAVPSSSPSTPSPSTSMVPQQRLYHMTSYTRYNRRRLAEEERAVRDALHSPSCSSSAASADADMPYGGGGGDATPSSSSSSSSSSSILISPPPLPFEAWSPLYYACGTAFSGVPEDKEEGGGEEGGISPKVAERIAIIRYIMANNPLLDVDAMPRATSSFSFSVRGVGDEGSADSSFSSSSSSAYAFDGLCTAPIHYAALCGQKAILQCLVDEFGANPRLRSNGAGVSNGTSTELPVRGHGGGAEDTFTPLQYACCSIAPRDNVAVVRYLTERCSSGSTDDFDDPFVSGNGYEEGGAGAGDGDASTNAVVGHSPFFIAAQCYKWEVVEYLANLDRIGALAGTASVTNTTHQSAAVPPLSPSPSPSYSPSSFAFALSVPSRVRLYNSLLYLLLCTSGAVVRLRHHTMGRGRMMGGGSGGGGPTANHNHSNSNSNAFTIFNPQYRRNASPLDLIEVLFGALSMNTIYRRRGEGGGAVPTAAMGMTVMGADGPSASAGESTPLPAAAAAAAAAEGVAGDEENIAEEQHEGLGDLTGLSNHFMHCAQYRRVSGDSSPHRHPHHPYGSNVLTLRLAPESTGVSTSSASSSRCYTGTVVVDFPCSRRFTDMFLLVNLCLMGVGDGGDGDSGAAAAAAAAAAAETPEEGEGIISVSTDADGGKGGARRCIIRRCMAVAERDNATLLLAMQEEERSGGGGGTIPLIEGAVTEEQHPASASSSSSSLLYRRVDFNPCTASTPWRLWDEEDDDDGDGDGVIDDERSPSTNTLTPTHNNALLSAPPSVLQSSSSSYWPSSPLPSFWFGKTVLHFAMATAGEWGEALIGAMLCDGFGCDVDGYPRRPRPRPLRRYHDHHADERRCTTTATTATAAIGTINHHAIKRCCHVMMMMMMTPLMCLRTPKGSAAVGGVAALRGSRRRPAILQRAIDRCVGSVRALLMRGASVDGGVRGRSRGGGGGSSPSPLRSAAPFLNTVLLNRMRPLAFDDVAVLELVSLLMVHGAEGEYDVAAAAGPADGSAADDGDDVYAAVWRLVSQEL